MRFASHISVVLFCINLTLGQLLYEDDPCRTNAGDRGVCKRSVNCPEAIANQRKTGIRPTLCGFEGGSPIICCPDSNNDNSNLGNVNFNPRPRPGGSGGTFSPRPSSSGSRPLTNAGNSGGSRVSEEMCKKYSKSVTQDFHALPLLPDPEPLTITVPKCIHNSSPLIVGGEDALVGEFPHMAAIGYDDPGKSVKFNCGGTLISEYYVVTAAHCSYSRDLGQPIVVRLGDHDLESTDDRTTPEDYQIENVTVYPEYKYPSKYHDIALIRLGKGVKFNDNIRPACLWQRTVIEQSNAVATGWGQLAYGHNGPRTPILQKVSLNLIDQSRCSALPALAPSTGRRPILSRGLISEQLCAGDLEKGGVDTCQGDSGGPLQVTTQENRCIFYVIGLTSYGIGCGSVDSPGVYTRISSYIDWIERVVWSQ